MPKTRGQLKLEEERATNAKQPDTWEDLPELIWAKVLKYFGSNDVNNIHLVSRKFHNIANMYSTSGMMFISLEMMSSKIHQKALMKSSRIFTKIKILRVIREFVSFPERLDRDLFNKNFKVLMDIAKKFGPHVEELFFHSVDINLENLLELLKNFPKLKTLELIDTHHHRSAKNQGEKKLIIELPYLKTLTMNCCDEVLEHLGGFAIRKVSFSDYFDAELVGSFLKEQQLNIKELSLNSYGEDQHDVLAELTNMQLDYLDMYTENWELLYEGEKLEAFLRHQPNLKYLCLQRASMSDERLCAAIESMPNLETIILKENCYTYLSNTSTDQLYKLTKLKKLVIDLDDYRSEGEFRKVITNYLIGLKKTINENFEELETFLPEVSKEFMAELAVSIPNLKKLKIKTRSHTVIELVMKYFKKLEELVIEYETYSNRNPRFSLDEKVLLKLKKFRLENYGFKINTKVARKLVNNFPNLEHLELDHSVGLTTRCIKILLRGMKKLKILRLEYDNFSMTREKADELVRAHAKCLQEFKTNCFTLTYRNLYDFFPENYNDNVVWEV